MTEDMEERFRAACESYLAAAEQADTAAATARYAQLAAKEATQAADRARDQLLQVVRERDLQAQLDGYGPAGGPVGDGLDDQRRAHYGPRVSVVRPENTDHWAKHGGMCPECGVSWREPSPDCPHKTVNWHPLAESPPYGL